MLVMLDELTHRVRERRLALGLSQIALAAAAGLSRQSLGAIEAGRSTPSVEVALRLARALDATVEALFCAGGAADPVLAERAGPGTAGRVALARIADRWVAHPLGASGARTCADGLAGEALDACVLVEPVRPLDEAAANVFVMGCAAALGLLADRLNAGRGPGRFVWLQGSSTRSLEALGRRHVHLAGVHLVDARTGEANVADVRRLAPTEPVALITLGRWEAGIVVAPANPKGLNCAADLARPDLRLAIREQGSGARRLLDAELARAGAAGAVAERLEAAGHLEVAHAVALGAADAGVATRDAAIAYRLGFVPLAEERYDLVVPLALLGDSRVERLFDVLTAGPTRRELGALGYDLGPCGDRVADLHAA